MNFEFSIILLINISIFSLIFWLLTILGELFVKKYNLKQKIEFYECGFKATHTNQVTFNFNFMLISFFLVLYDVEFLLFTPLFFNFGYLNLKLLIWILFFFFLIITSLWFDWFTNSLNWSMFGN